MLRPFLTSLAGLLALSAVSEASAFAYYCTYGAPRAVIPPPYYTLYCTAEIGFADVTFGDHLHQDTFFGSAAGQTIKVVGSRTTVWTYTAFMTFATHWVRLAPDQPVGQYIISSEFTGLKSGQPPYQGPDSDSATAPLGPP